MMVQIITVITMIILCITVALLHFGCITLSQTAIPVVIALIIAVLIPSVN